LESIWAKECLLQSKYMLCDNALLDK
jgi:hypothetical protein